VPQCNNSYVFPGMALGILGSGARRVSDAMFMAASTALAEASPARSDPSAPILPPLAEVRSISRRIALAVGREALSAGLTDEATAESLERDVDARIWSPVYRPYALRK
jgi:malate dehydrogenase (oxaloacetate-decarboxylating)